MLVAATVAGVVLGVLPATPAAIAGPLSRPGARPAATARARPAARPSRSHGARAVPRPRLALRANALLDGGGGNGASIFLQVSSLGPTYTPAEVAGWMRDVCATPAGPDGRTLVLQDVVDAAGGLSTEYLDVIAPHLPGGSDPCFSRVYVGTESPTWTGGGSAYAAGVESPSFASAYVASSAALAHAFVTAYPWVQLGWYLSYEADLNQLYYPAVEQAYAAMLSSEMRALSAVRPDAGYLWSPGFLYPYATYHTNALGMAGLSAGLGRLFTTLRSVGGIQVVDLQDEIGTANCEPAADQVSPADAVAWAHFLAGVPAAPTVELNTELFQTDCATGGLVPLAPAVATARERYYLAHGAALGPAYELRYWLPDAGYALSS